MHDFPLFPLDLVALPHELIPLHSFEERFKTMMNERLRAECEFGIVWLLSLASTPPMAGYSASKAAAHSLTHALRPVLRERGMTVHGVYPAGIDTDMLDGIDAPKTSPAEVAARLLDGLEAVDEDILGDPTPREWPPSGGATRRPSNTRSRAPRPRRPVRGADPETRRSLRLAGSFRS